MHAESEAMPEGLQASLLTTEAPAVVLTMAGFDPSNGAGVTADLQTFAAHGLFGTAAITALTVQSTLGVMRVQPSEPELLRQTLAHLAQDLPPRGIKIGMLGSAEVVEVVAEFLSTQQAGEKPIVVLDPVLRSSSGCELLPVAAVQLLHDKLLPQVGWITPNWGELAILSDCPVDDLGSAEHAAVALAERHPGLAIVATGGDNARPTDLLRLPDGSVHRFEGERVETSSTHGTGCAFSSALLAQLVLGVSPVEAVASAKAFVHGALRHAPGLGHGRGPLDLLWPLRLVQKRALAGEG